MKKRELRKILKKKGFTEVISKNHIYFYLKDPEDPEKHYSHIRTKLSHSGKEKDISDNLLAKIYKQLGFESKKEFTKYLDCKRTHRDHVEYLRNLGRI